MITDKSTCYRTDQLSWEPHPFLSGVQIKKIISSNDKIGITYCLSRVESDHQIEIHTHQDSDDMLFILKGEGIMYLEDIGEIPVEPGVFVRVPKGMKHGMVKVTEDLIFVDLFHPAAF